jgi:hypothetical protein
LKVRTFTWCGYKVAGMILLHKLKGVMQLDHSKDMSLHLLTCTVYDLSALTPVVWKLGADETCFYFLLQKMSDQHIDGCFQSF